MGRMDIFCASQAATAIRLSMEEGSSSSSSSSAFSSSLSSTAHLSGSRAIDRHNPIIGRRIPKSLPLPANCTSTSQPPPVDPIPYNQLIHQNHRKSTSSIPNDKTNKKSSSKTSGAGYKKNKISGKTVRFQDGGGGGGGGDIKMKSCAKLADLISPPGSSSSRYLLDDSAFFDVLPDFDPVMELFPVDERAKSSLAAKKKTEESSSSNPKTPSSRTPNQEVVVLRVSLHCKGCEGKVRKHISRMQGVTSFDIDFAAKKVTVEGDVTQSDVLASISKVKNAQLWAPPAISSCSVPVPAAAASSSYVPRNQEVQRNWCVK